MNPQFRFKMGVQSKYETLQYPIISLNIQSVKNKKIKLENLLDSFSKLPILCLTETWLKPEESNVYLPYFAYYNIYRVNRKNGYGGSAILIPKNFKVSLVDTTLNENFESVWVRIINNNYKIDIANIYRPPRPHSDVMPLLLNKYVEKNFKPNLPTIICGDFNYNKINWQTLTASRQLNQNEFLENMIQLGFKQYVNFPTRLDNILDLVFVNDENLITKIDVTQKLSDHESIVFKILTQKPIMKSKTFLDFKLANFEHFKELISRVNWVNIFDFENTNISKAWENFEAKIYEILNICVPMRTIKTKTNHFCSKQQKILCNKTKGLHKKYKKNPTQENYEKYLVASRISQRSKKQEILANEQKILNAGDINVFWKYVKSNLTYKSEIPCLIDKNTNELVSNDQSKAELLNDYFLSVFTRDNDILTDWHIPVINTTLENLEITETMLHNTIKNIKNKSSIGPDQIFSNQLIKKLMPEILVPLLLFLKKVFELSDLPNNWKIAKVISLYKAAEPYYASNYRPISLTSIPCKINEQIVAQALREYIKPYIFEHQHGFVQKKCTTTQLIISYDDWTQIRDEGSNVDVIFIDFAKAFDSVSHQKLINKLEKYGVKGQFLGWIKSFLTQRQQFVEVEGNQSKTGSVISGVPQGSVLGPLLFLIFINDLLFNISKNEKLKIKLFADDLKIYHPANTIEDKNNLQIALNELSEWANSSQLKVQPKKCMVLQIGKKQQYFKYILDNQELKSVDSIRDLGVIMNNKLTFDEHINQIISSATMTANLILRTFKTKNHFFLIKLFNAFVRPKLEYACQVWSPNTVNHIDRIERVQRSFTKRLPIIKHKTYLERLDFLKIISLEQRRLHLDLVFMFKIINNQFEIPFNEHFAFKNTQTRGHSKALKPTLPQPKYNICKFSFTQRIVQIWNSLTEDTIKANNVPTFKYLLSSQNPQITDYLQGSGPRGS